MCIKLENVQICSKGEEKLKTLPLMDLDHHYFIHWRWWLHFNANVNVQSLETDDCAIISRQNFYNYCRVWGEKKWTISLFIHKNSGQKWNFYASIFFSSEALSISRKHSDSSETMSLNFFPSSSRNLLSTTTTNHTNNKNLMMTLLLEKLLLPNNLI